MHPRLFWSVGVGPGTNQRTVDARNPNLAFCALFVLLLSCVSILAQPKITSVSPNWIQRGSTLTVTVAGESLSSVTGFVFSGDAGLSGSVILETNPPPSVTVESAAKGIAVASAPARDKNKSFRANITAGSDAP